MLVKNLSGPYSFPGWLAFMQVNVFYQMIGETNDIQFFEVCDSLWDVFLLLILW